MAATFTPVVFSHKVSVKLDDNNFLLWRPQILSAIRGHRLQDYISDSFQPPLKYLNQEDEVLGQINLKYTEWEVQDQLLYSWLLSSMSDGILTRILQNQKKGSLSVNEYLLRIKTIVDQLLSSGHLVTVKEHVAAIFKGLPPAYDTFVISVNSRNSPYSVAEIETLLLSQEHRMENQSRELDSVNLATNRGSRFKPQYSPNLSNNADSRSQNPPNRNTNQGHGVWNPYAISTRNTTSGQSFSNPAAGRGFTNLSAVSNSQAPSGSKLVCQLCSRTGHVASRCYQRFNMDFPGVGATNVQHHSANITTAETVSDDAWYPDSGATTHCTPNVSNFTQKQPYLGSDQVQMGDGAGLPIQNIGKKATK
uniref:Retrotransposon Copia-like N-terminal domain-containing protein n=1 Tax=Cannabis sativa TaxID=3483 RepID=A0A803QF40_CANSA